MSHKRNGLTDKLAAMDLFIESSDRPLYGKAYKMAWSIDGFYDLMNSFPRGAALAPKQSVFELPESGTTACLTVKCYPNGFKGPGGGGGPHCDCHD
jgi:hypothetical protein